MKAILLTQRKVALVDDEDYSALSHHKCRLACACGLHYAQRYSSVGTGISMHHKLLGLSDKATTVFFDGGSSNLQRSNLSARCSHQMKPRDAALGYDQATTKLFGEFVRPTLRREVRRRR